MQSFDQQIEDLRNTFEQIIEIKNSHIRLLEEQILTLKKTIDKLTDKATDSNDNGNQQTRSVLNSANKA